MPDHDELFKELIEAFLFDLLEQFVPASKRLQFDRSFHVALDRESPADLGPGRARRADLVYRIRTVADKHCILHIEIESSYDASLPNRMLYYFVVLFEKYKIPIIPVAILSFTSPRRRVESRVTVGVDCAGEEDAYMAETGGPIDSPQNRESLYESIGTNKMQFMQFDFIALQFNRLSWRDYKDTKNPIAAALMSVMRRTDAETAEVRLECLRSLARSESSANHKAIVQRFIDAYTPLTPSQRVEFEKRLRETTPPLQEEIMTYITSWERDGAAKKSLDILRRQLGRRFGENFDSNLANKVSNLEPIMADKLAEDLLDFKTVEDLIVWLDSAKD